MIRVKGFSWDWCKHPWSKDGRKYTIKELADHLRWIITEEKKHSIPDEPVISQYFTDQYQRKSRSVYFGIKKLAGALLHTTRGGFVRIRIVRIILSFLLSQRTLNMIESC